MTETDTSRNAVNDLASERDERAAESMMMADAHRNAGANAVASGWDAAAEAAMTQAATLRALLARAEKAEAENDRLRAALIALVDETCDYTQINNLGDPEKQHNIKLARAALKGADHD